MNALVLANYVIFAALFSLLLLELGSAIISILDCDIYKRKVIVYLSPLWEITGTLAVFYLVNVVASYPNLVPYLDYFYLVPALMAVIFLISRDAFLAYSELDPSKHSDKAYARLYGILTIVAMFFAITIFSSSMGGGGVSLSLTAANLPALFFNKFNILVFDAIVALASACAIVLFDLRYPKILGALALLSGFLLLAALYTHVPYVIAGILSNPYALLPVLLLLLAMIAVYLLDSKYAKFLLPPFLFVGILTTEFLEYPFLFGKTVEITSYAAIQPTSTYVLFLTVIGGIFLTAAFAVFVYVHHRKSGGKKAKGSRSQKPKTTS